MQHFIVYDIYEYIFVSKLKTAALFYCKYNTHMTLILLRTQIKCSDRKTKSYFKDRECDFSSCWNKKNVYPNITKNSMDTHILQYFLKYCQSLNTKYDGNASYLMAMCIQISRIRSQNVWCHFYCRILDGSLFMCNRRFSIFRTWWTQHGWRWQKMYFCQIQRKESISLNRSYIPATK